MVMPNSQGEVGRHALTLPGGGVVSGTRRAQEGPLPPLWSHQHWCCMSLWFMSLKGVWELRRRQGVLRETSGESPAPDVDR